MKNQLDIIYQIEKKLNTKLSQIHFDHIEDFDHYYSVNANKEIIALNLNCLRLRKLPNELLELKQLRTLCLRDNKITLIPIEILKLPNLTRINLEGNPIDPPIEVKHEGMLAIKSYLIAMHNEHTPINEVRIILVGDGGSGKTSVVKRIKGSGFAENEPKTDGINIDKLRIDSIKKSSISLRIWDFGGQEIMHSTHQFFLSKNTIYILVLDGRKDEKTEYWLKLIRTFGEDSPILIVLNKMDENPAFSQMYLFALILM